MTIETKYNHSTSGRKRIWNYESKRLDNRVKNRLPEVDTMALITTSVEFHQYI